jgi:hypothetical protein
MMPIDRESILPPEVMGTVRKRIGDLTEELKTKFDVGFRPGVYIPYTVDGTGLPDGIWVVFPPGTSAEFAHALIEAGYGTMQNFMDAGLQEKLESIRETRQNRFQSAEGSKECKGDLEGLRDQSLNPAE